MSKSKAKTVRDAKNVILESLKVFKNEASDLFVPKNVTILSEIPQSFDFHHKWVAPNTPVIIKGGIKQWPALKKWNKTYFCELFGNKKITVAVTPNGYADAITQTEIDGKIIDVFVLPEERLITVNDFFSKLDNESKFSDSKVMESKGIFYLQKQNSNLSEEFPELLEDIDKTLLWASDAFQSEPSAINLWIGDERAVTSLHKDPFENIYCVVCGSKEFILFPPTDRPWLPHKKVPVGQYKEKSPGIFEIKMLDSGRWMTKSDDDISDSSLEIKIEPEEIPWIDIDPSCPDIKKYPLYKNASPLRVRVEAGDVLYLPSMWFHHVTQSHKCIAVNYWYDMSMDIKYAYFQLLDYLSKSCDEFMV